MSGGNQRFPGLPLGSNIDVFVVLEPWDYVGPTGHLPGPGKRFKREEHATLRPCL